ncbi:MAG TPA: TonB-dependent receptor [Asticcacaulis sp.]|nr:TonB-dependent receptor [Asticcacaulis sp.]
MSLAAGLAVSANPDLAHAADGTFAIPAQPVQDALVALAMQSNISVGGADPVRCLKTSAPVNGRMAPERALRLMMAGGRCQVQRIDGRTFRLVFKSAALKAPPEPKRGDEAIPDNSDTTVLIVRRPQRISASPSAISVIPGSVMADDDQDISLLAQRVPGMTVTNLGPGRNKILLRGISDSVLTGRTQSTVGIYLDDAALTYNAPDPDLMLVDMARIEVLKGPQGALYGQGSLSGVVRLVTNKPRPDLYQSDASVGVGYTENGDVSSRAVGMINLPLNGKQAALRAVIYDDNSGGFIKDPTLGKQASNATTRVGARMALLWPIDPRFTLNASAVFQRLNSSNSQYVTSQRAPYRRALAVAEPHNNGFANLSADLDGTFDSGTLKVSFNHLRHTISSAYDAEPVARFATIPTSGILLYNEDQAISLSTEEISFLSPSHSRLRWLAGLFAAQSEEHFDPHLVDVYTHDAFYDEARIDKIDDVAAFGEINYDITSKWTASLGLRATRSRHETASRIDNVHLTGNAPDGQIKGVIHAGHIAHSLLVSYQPHSGLLLYVQTGDGFRTGGFNTTTQLVTNVPAVYTGDELNSYEGGLRFSTPDNKVRMQLAVFAIAWRNIQSDQLRSTGLPITVNIGKGVNDGVELEADWQALRNLTLHLAAQVNDPRLTRPSANFARDKDRGMPFIARQSVNLSAEWQEVVWRHRFENSFWVTYRSGSPLNYGALREVRIDGYTNCGFSSFINLRQVRLGLRVTNLTGVKSNSFAYGNPFSVDGSSQITPLRPRTLWLSVSHRY